MILSANASQVGVGSVLSHVLPDGNEKPIAYASRTLSATEKKLLANRKGRSWCYLWDKTLS